MVERFDVAIKYPCGRDPYAVMVSVHDGSYVMAAHYDAARAEIERLKREVDVAASAMVRNHNRAEKAEAERDSQEADFAKSIAIEVAARLKAEAERDEARAQVAASYDAVAEYIETVPLEVTDRQEHAKAIRALASDHAQSALEAYGREKVREGMQRAAGICNDKVHSKSQRHGHKTAWGAMGCLDAILAEMETLK